MAGSMSPSTSPRLPSPPPFPEVQIGPQSPAMNATQGIAQLDLEESAALDHGVTRRIRPGTKAADMASGPPLVPLAEVCLISHLLVHTTGLTCLSLIQPSNCRNTSRLSITSIRPAPIQKPKSQLLAALHASSPIPPKALTVVCGFTNSAVYLSLKSTCWLSDYSARPHHVQHRRAQKCVLPNGSISAQCTIHPRAAVLSIILVTRLTGLQILLQTRNTSQVVCRWAVTDRALHNRRNAISRTSSGGFIEFSPIPGSSTASYSGR